MLTELKKVTPMIGELQHYEGLANMLEQENVPIHIGGNGRVMEYGLNKELLPKVQKAIHSIVASEVRRLQKELARTLKCLGQ